jgi:hypothetical protein
MACTDQHPTVPLDLTIQPAKPAGVGAVKVDATDPPAAEQETTLDVRILGSGFDNGSKASWLLAGEVKPNQVKTNSTKFLSSTELEANITIALDATVALWDVEVMTIRGKKGIGIECFEVKEKTPPGQVVFDDYTPVELGTLGNNPRKSSSRALDVSDPIPGDVLLVTGTSQKDDRSDEVPVIWTVSGTGTDVVVDGPTPLPLPGSFFSGRAGRMSSDDRYIVGWIFKDEYVNGEPLARAARWEFDNGAPVTFEPLVGPDDVHGGDDFLASAGRGVNQDGDVVGNSSAGHPVEWDLDGDGTIDFHAPKIATVWDGISGQPTPLLSPLGGQSIAYGINNQGYVVGTGMEPVYFNPSGELERHAILWLLDGIPCDLGATGVRSEAYNLTDMDGEGSFIVTGTWDSRGTVWKVTPDEGSHSCEVFRQSLDVYSIVGGIRMVDGGWEVSGMGEIIVPGQNHPLSWRFDITGSTVTPLGEVGRGMGMNSGGIIAGFIPVKDQEQAVLWLPKNQ